MIALVRFLDFTFLAFGVHGCRYFMSPRAMLETAEADDRCYQRIEETRKEIKKLAMDYTQFNRGCRLNEQHSMYLGLEDDYLTGNQEQDAQIMASWTVVKTFKLNNWCGDDCCQSRLNRTGLKRQ